ncbi:MAG: DUF4198 domain-containing protein, partial [Acidobacteria bacterium ACB2]|nr:DUF4198 domain-containing protein [Acidobacteria bacterium ACB2]
PPARARAGKAAPRPTPSRPALVSGDSGSVELATGSRFPVSEAPVEPATIDRTFVRFGPGRPMPMTGARADGAVTKLEATYAGAGVAALAVQLKPVFAEVPAAEFDAWLEEVGAADVAAERRKRKETKKPGRQVTTACAKTFAHVADPRKVAVAAPALESAAEPLGLPLELVLSADPSGLRAGQTVGATLLSDGKASGGHVVRLLDAEGTATAFTTAPDGSLTVPLARPGRLLLAATVLRRTTKADRKRAEAYRKADWESLGTSLLLEVLPPPQPPAATPKPTGKPGKKPRRP